MKSKLTWILTSLMVLSVSFSFAQGKTISGNVTDQAGLPLPGVSVVVVGTSTGTQTDFDGNYTVSASQGQVLRFSYIGQKTVNMTVGASNVLNVQMEEDAQALEEVVVIAYGSQTKQKLVQSVSTVGADDIRDIPAVSPQELLQGQASGVQVVNSSGILGAAPVIKIRGVASISSGGRPLIVVDGVPLNDDKVTNAQGGQSLNPLADINPNDIESFSVLKDAAATAVYGSRGSNGVILISTKSGKLNQATRITLDVNTSWTESTDNFEMMNADQLRQFLVDAGRIGSVNDRPQGNFDWFPAVIRTGISKDINLGVSGGNEKTTYFMGLTVKDQEGFIIGNNLNRIGGRLNLSHQATDWLKLGMNVGMTETRNDRVGSENNTAAPTTSALLQFPWVQPRDENGNFVNTGFIQNVVALEQINTNYVDNFRTIANVYGEIALSDALKFKSDFGIDRAIVEQFQRNAELLTPGGFALNSVDQINKFILSNTLAYDRTFGTKHDISAIAGMSYEQRKLRGIVVTANGFLSDAQTNTISASTPGTTNNFVNESRLIGYFARANYAYDNKYIVEGSFRRDGSTRFGADNRYGNFWSAGGAWVISEESFLRDSQTISNLKLRGNFGTAGNDRIGDYASLENFEGGIISNYNGASGLRQLAAANPDLRWEKSESYDIGLEVGLFNNRVRFNVDYYKKKTTDLILNVPIPQTNGGLNSIIANVGEMENRGFDGDISWDVFRGQKFDWTTSFNFGANRNEVLSLPGANLDDEGRRFVAGSGAQRAIEGLSVNNFYLIRYNGVNPQTGDAEWLDIDGNPTINPTTADRVVAGDANPDLVGGFRNNLRYGNFDLNFFFNFSVGNDILVDGLRFTDNAFSFNNRTALLDVWQNPGDNAYVPSFSSPTFGGRFAQRSTAQLRDGSFARLKNITLGYNLPKMVMDKIGFLQGVRLYATANNVLTIKGSDLKGIDPEVSNSIGNGVQGETFFTPPQAKTYLIGARISF